MTGTETLPDWQPVADAAELGHVRLAAIPTAHADQRALDRVSHGELDRVAVSLRIPGQETWAPVRLWDFTSIGFGIWIQDDSSAPEGSLHDPILAREKAATGLSGKPLPWREMDEVEVRIRLGARHEYQVWCQVRNVSRWRGGTRIGLRRLDLAFPQTLDAERRSALRLGLSPTLSLKARIRHPFLYGHWCRLIASDLNQDLGMSFLCNDPSILLFEGMELEICFELSAFRQEPMRALVAWVHATDSDQVKFGVQCISVDHRLHNALCDYLLFSQYWTPAKLRAAGFQSKRVRSHLRFSAVRTMDDYAEVLHLRRDAYVGAGKRPQGTRPEHMSTALDGRSRILMARHHGKLVGTMTYTFPASEETVLDSQAGFPGAKYPVRLPPKMNMIEVSRLCIDESYRGTDLLVGIFEHGLKHFLLSDRHWLLTSATDELVPLYRRIGFVKLKAAYKHPLLGNRDHHLLIAHKSAFLWGFGIGLYVWNSVFGDLIRHLLERKRLQVPAWMRIMIRCKLMFRPLARRSMDAMTRRAFSRHLEALRNARKPD
jgi:hypothetical protein